MPSRFLGVFLNCLYAQNEGVESVLDNIQSMGAQAICLTPKVAWPSATGTRFPDLHVDGHARLVSRRVWGAGEAHIETAYAFEPNARLYDSGPYSLPEPVIPSQVDKGLPGQLISEAKRRGMDVHLLLHPFLRPAIRPDDRPLRIDGSRPAPPLVANSACLNAPAAQTYGLALLQDLVEHYADIDGLIPDWVEFGAYRFFDLFTCFCPHCERAARAQGYDWERMRQDVRSTWEWCHALSSEGLLRSRRILGQPSALAGLLARYPGWLELIRFKSETVRSFYAKARARLDETGCNRVAIAARGWPPPWNLASGMDYRSAASVCSMVAPKLFTFDYSAMPRWYGETLQSWNPELGEGELLDALVEWMNLPDDNAPRSFSQYHIPAPGEPHPAKMAAYRDRIDEVVDLVDGRAPCCPIAHAYLPEPQWREMMATVRESRADGVWVHMYGYLSGAKMDIVREEWR